MKTEQHDAIVLSSKSEKENFQEMTDLLKKCPLPSDELLANLGLFLPSKHLSRLLFFYEVYQRILPLHGAIVEFGVRWGQNVALLSALRGIFEPFNRHRKIIGFDTFEGFKGHGSKDGDRNKCVDGSFSVSSEYEKYLENIMSLHEQLNPIPHLKKFELVKGDARQTVPQYFKKHPETIVSLAIFDFDIYEPTRAALEVVLIHVCKGSILVFDELSDDIFPGETIAFKELLSLRNLKVERFPMTSRVSFVEIP